VADEIQDPLAAVAGAGTPPVIAPGHTFSTVTDKISAIVLTRRTPIGWWLGFSAAFALAGLLFISLGYLVVKGIGIWGNNIPVGWAFDITNLVWWIGIGHAGTLISAILLLLKQTWRTSINRFAEAMTLFAVACAGIFPLFHTGRPWLAYWMFPYPNTMSVWPQFRSPLMWDVFAISTYATVSLLFWFIGLIPDLATLRDRSQSRIGRIVYGCWRWAGADRRTTGIATRPRTSCSPASPRRSSSRCTRSSASISRSASCPAGTPRSSRRTSSPARSTRASRWC
jgi:molybdopterin-containing oxidoreductase family membrane subunit